MLVSFLLFLIISILRNEPFCAGPPLRYNTLKNEAKDDIS